MCIYTSYMFHVYMLYFVIIIKKKLIVYIDLYQINL